MRTDTLIAVVTELFSTVPPLDETPQSSAPMRAFQDGDLGLVGIYNDNGLQAKFDLINISTLDTNFSDVSHNLSKLWNASGGLNIDLIGKFERNRRIEGPLMVVIVVTYGILISLGTVGNMLVVFVVIRKPSMRTARNVFIINLAISDLLLCLITTPLTLIEIMTQYWPFGDTPLLCKSVDILQATSIFVSSISITAIALDRYQVIVYPNQRSLGTRGALLVLPLIWVIAVSLALPLFIIKTLTHYVINLPRLREVNFCYEEWPTRHGRALYSVFAMLVQLCLPLLTVSVSYARIVRRLTQRMSSTAKLRSHNSIKKDRLRSRKTNILLMTIAVIFCLSWLPFHVYSIVVDFINPFGEDTEAMHVVYAACHALGMSSACSNPVLYGWLNENFRKEFTEIGLFLCGRTDTQATLTPRRMSTSECSASRRQSYLNTEPCKLLQNDSVQCGKLPQNGSFHSDRTEQFCISYLEEKRHYIFNGTGGSKYISFYEKCTQV